VVKRRGLGELKCEVNILNTYILDNALPHAKLALEANGPWHYLENSSTPLGRTLLRERILRGLGWAVATVDQRLWQLTPESEREAFVEQTIDSALRERKRRESIAPSAPARSDHLV
jgi:very-short-patch-repair endonuclease